jgi:hypothetical protein
MFGKIWRALLICFGILSTWVAIDRWWPEPKIKVSREMTYITEPLDEFGMPDYVRYVNEMESEGVTPENNAAVLIWEAMWPGKLKPEYQMVLCEHLGMAIPDGTRAVQPFDEQRQHLFRDRLNREAGEEYAESELIDEILFESTAEPWTTEQFPEIAEWIRENSNALDVLVEAATRSHYYSPRPESLIEDSQQSLLLMDIPDASAVRDACRHLCRRAMWHVGEQRPAEAWSDIRAVYQLAQHLARSPTLTVQLVAISADAVATECTLGLLHHGNLLAHDAHEILRELQTLTPPSPEGMGYSLGTGERLAYLDMLSRLATRRLTFEDLGQGAGARSKSRGMSFGAKFDWRVGFEEANAWFDRLQEAVELPRDARLVKCAEYDRDIQNIGRPGISAIGGLVSRKQRAAVISRLLLALCLPALPAAMDASDREQCWWQIRITAGALSVYRAEHGEYPESLEQLVPDVVENLPVDFYSGRPLIYQRRTEGYLLYSVFENGVDDGGDDFTGRIIDGEWIGEDAFANRDQSDLVVLMPHPKFVMLKSHTKRED